MFIRLELKGTGMKGQMKGLVRWPAYSLATAIAIEKQQDNKIESSLAWMAIDRSIERAP